tara:strand:+ start:150 stop:437 length:288 start_codon:yes stop_codon:yes gene_type:complete
MNPNNHIGFPLPSEMFNRHMDKKIKIKTINEEWDKHEKISELLDIPLRCPHCGEVLKGNGVEQEEFNYEEKPKEKKYKDEGPKYEGPWGKDLGLT